MKKLLFICNPRSGQLKMQRSLYDVLDLFSAAGYESDVYFTQSRGDASIFAEGRGKYYRLVVCCGGDGTLNEVVNGLMKLEKPPAIGYIPTGTTNDFAASLGLSCDIKTAAEAVLSGNTVKLDAGLFGSRYFTYIASFGAFTESSYTAPQELKNSIGHLAYVLQGLCELPNLRPLHVKLRSGSRLTEDDYIFGAVSNSTSIGGIVKLGSDTVNMSDGEFEVVLVRNPSSMIEMREIVIAVQLRDYNSCDCITLFHASEVEFITGGISWSVDGEQCCDGGHVTVKNIHNALTFTV